MPDPTSGGSKISVLNAWIPLETPSMNSMLQIIWSQRRVEATKEVSLFRARIGNFLPVWEPPKKTPLRLRMLFYQDWFTAAGEPIKKDVGNLCKAIEDCLCKRYAYDDRWHWERVARKVQDKVRVGVRVRIEPVGMGAVEGADA